MITLCAQCETVFDPGKTAVLVGLQGPLCPKCVEAQPVREVGPSEGVFISLEELAELEGDGPGPSPGSSNQATLIR